MLASGRIGAGRGRDGQRLGNCGRWPQ